MNPDAILRIASLFDGSRGNTGGNGRRTVGLPMHDNTARMQTFSYMRRLALDGRAKANSGMLVAENDTAARDAIKVMMDPGERRQSLEIELLGVPLSATNTICFSTFQAGDNRAT